MKLKMKRVLGVLLALALVIGLLPEMNLTAYAGTGAYSSLIPEGNDDATALANKVVTFNGIEWYIIKDESQGESSGTVTLLAKDPISASKFHGSSNSYDGSMVKEDLVRLLTAEGANSFKGVADAINPVTLTTHAYNSTTVVKETIENAKLWLLSISEAKDLPENIRKCSQNGGDGNFWWLRSPGGDDDYAACVSGGDGYVGGYGRNVTSSCGVRPALQLNLSSVIFSSSNRTFETEPTANKNLVYNGNNQNLVTAPASSNYTYSLTENGTYNNEIPQGKNAGNYTVYYKENGTGQAKSLTVTIARREVTVEGITVKDKVYDGTTAAELDYTGVTYKSGSTIITLGSGDTLPVTATGTYADANAGDSKNVTISNVTTSGAVVGNYTLAASGNQSSATGKITKKPVTVTAKPQSVEVNGTIKNQAGEAVLSGAVEGHTLTAVTLTAGNVSAAGSSTVMPGNAIIKSGGTDVTGNYEITYAAGILTVTKTQPELKVDTIQPGGFTSSTAKLNGSISPAEYGTGDNVADVGFRYRKAGASDWESVAGTVGSTFSAEITGLTADSDYEYFAVMTVNGDTTEKEGKKLIFHTPKAVNTDTGKITVTVAKDTTVTGNPEVVVSVEKGNDVIASKELGALGSRNLSAVFEKLADGNYNVVASTKDGNFKETKMLSITNGIEVVAEFTVLKGKIAAVVEVNGTDTPKTAVDGLKDVLDSVLTTQEASGVADGSKAVEVKLDRGRSHRLGKHQEPFKQQGRDWDVPESVLEENSNGPEFRDGRDTD